MNDLLYRLENIHILEAHTNPDGSIIKPETLPVQVGYPDQRTPLIDIYLSQKGNHVILLNPVSDPDFHDFLNYRAVLRGFVHPQEHPLFILERMERGKLRI